LILSSFDYVCRYLLTAGLSKTVSEQTTDLISKVVAPCSHLLFDTSERAEAEVLVSTHSTTVKNKGRGHIGVWF
jgi:hypothetical protein